MSTRRLWVIIVTFVALMVVAIPAFAQEIGDVAADEPELVFNLAWVGAVIGFFLPLLISFIKRASMSIPTKRAIAFTVSAIAGVVNTGVQAGWTFDSTSAFVSLAALSIVDVYVVASVIYQNFWDGTAVETKLAEVGDGGE